jgi:hypothetical protein
MRASQWRLASDPYLATRLLATTEAEGAARVLRDRAVHDAVTARALHDRNGLRRDFLSGTDVRCFRHHLDPAGAPAVRTGIGTYVRARGGADASRHAVGGASTS